MSATLETMSRTCPVPSPLTGLRNISPAIAARLEQVGVRTPDDLAAVGPIEVYRRLKRISGCDLPPVSLYLYALEGALRDVHWDHLPLAVKARLIEEVER